MHYYIEPEVAGGLGQNTIADTSVHPPNVSKLHYELDGWLEDDLLESFPCFIVTSDLKQKLDSIDLTGLVFDSVEITISEQFKEMYPNKKVPDFYWLKPKGVPGKDDFGMSDDYRLVVSSQALSVIQTCRVAQADIEEYKPNNSN